MQTDNLFNSVSGPALNTLFPAQVSTAAGMPDVANRIQELVDSLVRMIVAAFQATGVVPGGGTRPGGGVPGPDMPGRIPGPNPGPVPGPVIPTPRAPAPDVPMDRPSPVPVSPAGTPPGERTLIASDNAVTAGSLNVDDAYDLRLYKEADGNYTAEVYMKLDFDFRNGTEAADSPLNWSDAEKQQFIADYEASVEAVWDGHVLETLPDGSEVKLDVTLDSAERGVTGENWSVNVTKIEDGGFARSSVSPSGKSVNLDSEDITLTTKSGGFQQTGAAHEFGHMIGLPDEYTPGSPNIADTDSIMHGGQVVENRHVDDLGDWVRAQLPN